MARPFDDAPDMLIESARETLREQQRAEQHDEAGKRLARRLFIAFVLTLALAGVFFVLLPQIGIDLPPLIPLMSFGVIFVAAILNHSADAPDAQDPASRTTAGRSTEDQGRPVGCCSGPGHLRCFRDNA
ncbi:MAG: hypothetical protein AAF235_01840 [Planctomycetota bacterium]